MPIKRTSLFAVLTALLLLAASVAPAYAQSFDGGLTIAIPEGFTETEIKGKQVLFHGENESLGIEMAVYSQRNVQTNKTHTWSEMSEEELSTMAAGVIEQQDGESTTMETWSLCSNDQINYIVFEGGQTGDDENSLNFIQYCTIINGGTLQMTFYKTSEFTDSDREMAKTMAMSAHFDQLTEPGIDTKLILELAGVALAIVLLILSVVWNIRRYRRKIKKEAEAQVEAAAQKEMEAQIEKQD